MFKDRGNFSQAAGFHLLTGKVRARVTRRCAGPALSPTARLYRQDTTMTGAFVDRQSLNARAEAGTAVVAQER